MNGTELRKHPGPRTLAANGSEDAGSRAHTGLILLDKSLRVIARDRGADAIFGTQNGAESTQCGSPIPAEILDLLRTHHNGSGAPLTAHLHVGGCDYIIRAYFIEPEPDTTDGLLMAVSLERDAFALTAIGEIVAPYNLTQREQEAFTGILLGLSTKELATRMNISPNTVKAFLRLIMIKMGVTTRAGIVARILQGRGSLENAHAAPGNRGERAG